MAPMGVVARFLERFRRDPVGAVTRIVPLWDLDRSHPPPGDVEEYARSGYIQNAVIHACVKELATSTAEPPLLAERAGEELPPGHPYRRLADVPNPEQTPYEFSERIVTDLSYGGNAVLKKVRARSGGLVRELWPLRLDRVEITPTSAGRVQYEHGVAGTGNVQTIPAEDVIHVAYPHPLDDFWGLSPIQVVAAEGDLDNDAVTFLREFFLNAGLPAAVLTSNQNLTDGQRDRIRDQWKDRYGRRTGETGGTGWHEVAVLSNGATFQPIGTSPDKLDLEAILSETEARICAVYGVPPLLVGVRVGLVQSSAYGTAREARRSFWRETLRPLYRRIETKLSLELAQDFGPQFSMRYDLAVVDALQEDKSVNRRDSALGWNSGILLLNEARELYGVPPVPGGDVRKPEDTARTAAAKPATASRPVRVLPAGQVAGKTDEEVA